MTREPTLFFVGITAGCFSLFLSFLLRILFGGVYLPELAAQTVFSITPGNIESQAVETLGSFAKYSAFVGATAVNLILYGMLAVTLPSVGGRAARGSYLARALSFSLAAYSILLSAAALLLETTEVLTQSNAFPYLALVTLPPNLLFGFTLTYLDNGGWHLRKSETTLAPLLSFKVDHKRRLAIRAVGAVLVAATILFYGVDIIFPKAKPTSPPSEPVKPTSGAAGIFADPAVAALTASEVTTNEQFYRVDVNITTPIVDVSTWKLTVKGLVNNPLTLMHDELKSMPSVQQYSTLECISNLVGGDLISTALWRGVPLKALLERAQVQPEATYIVFRCHDGYDVGIPLERGLSDGAILAYEMNQVPLPQGHGFPLRAIIPGLYGMMNPKWITEIELVDKTHEGFWQRRGWANNAKYQTGSTIVTPGDSILKRRLRESPSQRVVRGRGVPIAGIAFAGDRGISKVEVSTDGGNAWVTAEIKEPLSPSTWVMWATQWVPPAAGKYILRVRAMDKAGWLQTAEFQNPFPSGTTGFDRMEINVESPP